MTAMGRTYDEIDDRLARFLLQQPMFFVASAPLESSGHVNVSPKGLGGTFTILDPFTVAYLDLTGSGVETIAHIRQNGRITLMFCAFEGPPRIVRLYGRGQVVLPDDPAFAALCLRFAPTAGARAIITISLDRVADSCGYGVPEMTFRSERRQLLHYYERSGGDAGLADYRRERNSHSIDGLEALPASPT
jgi:hypothetical protein